MDHLPRGIVNIMDPFLQEIGNLVALHHRGTDNIVDPRGNVNSTDPLHQGTDHLVDPLPRGKDNSVDHLQGTVNLEVILLRGIDNLVDLIQGRGNLGVQEIDNLKVPLPRGTDNMEDRHHKGLDSTGDPLLLGIDSTGDLLLLGTDSMGDLLLLGTDSMGDLLLLGTDSTGDLLQKTGNMSGPLNRGIDNLEALLPKGTDNLVDHLLTIVNLTDRHLQIRLILHHLEEERNNPDIMKGSSPGDLLLPTTLRTLVKLRLNTGDLMKKRGSTRYRTHVSNNRLIKVVVVIHVIILNQVIRLSTLSMTRGSLVTMDTTRPTRWTALPLAIRVPSAEEEVPLPAVGETTRGGEMISMIRDVMKDEGVAGTTRQDAETATHRRPKDPKETPVTSTDPLHRHVTIPEKRNNSIIINFV
jgi:hypothetical protein